MNSKPSPGKSEDRKSGILGKPSATEGSRKDRKSGSPDDNRGFLLRYAALGTQLLAAIAIGVFIGLKADRWLNTSPLLACVLPLLILSVIFYKLYRETSKKKPNE